MGWEPRGRGRYYYHKKRDGGRVVSEYCGRGDLGHMVAAEVDSGKTLFALLRDLDRAERQEQRAIDAAIDQAGGLVRALMQDALTRAGYHQHKRQWRKRRT